MRPDCPDDWVEVRKLERDILLLYHTLMAYNGIMGDLDYESVFSRPYWEYLNPTGLCGPRAIFIQEGCLIMVLAMARGALDGSCSYLMQFSPEVITAVERCRPLGNEGGRLHAHVRDVLGHAVSEIPADENKLAKESLWIHENVIRKYYKNMLERRQDGSGGDDEMDVS